MLLLLLVLAQSFEPLMGDAEEGAVLDAVFDGIVFVFVELTCGDGKVRL